MFGALGSSRFPAAEAEGYEFVEFAVVVDFAAWAFALGFTEFGFGFGDLAQLGNPFVGGGGADLFGPPLGVLGWLYDGAGSVFCRLGGAGRGFGLLAAAPGGFVPGPILLDRFILASLACFQSYRFTGSVNVS